MESDDIYHARLRELAASMKAWSGFVADVSRFHITEESGFWRMSMEPAASRACPLEIVIDTRSRDCDITIGRQTYESWPLPSLDLVLPLAKAVSEGRVVTRRLMRTATALPVAVTTLITLADGTRLHLSENAAAVDAESGVECRETHYVPYRKPAAVA